MATSLFNLNIADSIIIIAIIIILISIIKLVNNEKTHLVNSRLEQLHGNQFVLLKYLSTNR